MELKFRNARETYNLALRSNRTFMELKFLNDFVHNYLRLSSNRTFMELKFRSPVEKMLPDTF